MISTPPGLATLHRIHQQLTDLRSRRALGDDSEVTRLKTDLDSAVEALPKNVRVAYDRVVQSKGLEAISAAEGQACGGCYQMLTLNTYNNLQLGKVTYCDSCGRLLYLETDG